MTKPKVAHLIAQLTPTYERTVLTFPQLDTDKIKVKLRLEEEAIKRGKSNLPLTEQTQPDDIEQKIASFIQNEVKSATESYYDHLRSFEDRITRLHAEGNVAALDNIVVTAEGDFDAHIKQDTNHLYTAKRNVRNSEKDLKAFQQKNGLESAAHYPESRFYYFAIAMLMVVFETTINGYFFAQGHEMGMLGGGFTALIPSLLNIFLGFCIGNFAFRLAIHKRLPKKLSGIFLCCFIPCVVITINLLVAHYRSILANTVDVSSIEAARSALESFAQAPLNLHDVESWLLFATGFVFCLIATIDFWKMDDPYPHYGAISREYEKKLQYYADLKSASIGQLTDQRDHAYSNLQEVSDRVNAKMSEANSVTDSQQRWEILFAEHLTHLENAGRELIGFYRTHNMGARDTTPPTYYNREWKLIRPSLPKPGIDFLKALDGFKSEGQAMAKASSKSSNKIAAAYKDALQTYQTIEDLNMEDGTDGKKAA